MLDQNPGLGLAVDWAWSISRLQDSRDYRIKGKGSFGPCPGLVSLAFQQSRAASVPISRPLKAELGIRACLTAVTGCGGSEALTPCEGAKPTSAPMKGPQHRVAVWSWNQWWTSSVRSNGQKWVSTLLITAVNWFREKKREKTVYNLWVTLRETVLNKVI